MSTLPPFPPSQKVYDDLKGMQCFWAGDDSGKYCDKIKIYDSLDKVQACDPSDVDSRMYLGREVSGNIDSILQQCCKSELNPKTVGTCEGQMRLNVLDSHKESSCFMGRKTAKDTGDNTTYDQVDCYFIGDTTGTFCKPPKTYEKGSQIEICPLNFNADNRTMNADGTVTQSCCSQGLKVLSAGSNPCPDPTTEGLPIVEIYETKTKMHYCFVVGSV